MSVFSASFLANHIFFSCQLYYFTVHLMFCSFIPTLFSFSQKNLWHNISYTWPSSLAIFVNILGLVFNLVMGIFKPSVVRQVRELCTSHFLAINTEVSSSFHIALHPTFLARQCTFLSVLSAAAWFVYQFLLLDAGTEGTSHCSDSVGRKYFVIM